ncbi:type II secretion system secretin GspD [Desulfococcaceae bacterium HSG8]|nr:type II secretion system secretin GspD [Desulfococcaceae bacterium HSG8]
MMKRISEIRTRKSGFRFPASLIIFFVLCGVMIFHPGCSGQKFSGREKAGDTGISEIKEKPEKETPAGDEKYELVPTPFGKIKRQVLYEEKETEPVVPERKGAGRLVYSENIRTPESPKYKSVRNPPVPPQPAPSGQHGDITLNFDSADLYEVIRVMAELLNISYIVDPNVRGTVTIHTAGKLRGKDLFPVFLQILELNGLTAVRQGSLYKIVNLKDASRMPVITRFGDSERDVPPGERVIIQIIPLEFISGQEITKLLTPFISAEGSIVSHEDSNTLLIVDKSSNILKALKLVKVFDVNVFDKVSHRFYPLEYVNAEDMVKTLKEIIASYKIPKDAVKIIGVERLNILIAISSVPHAFASIEQVIRQLDVPGHEIEPRIYVYSVKNGEADELAKLLNSVFSTSGAPAPAKTEKTTTKKNSQPEKKTARRLFETPAPVKKKAGATALSGLKSGNGSGILRSDIRITPDEVRNALIIEAIPKDFHLIENILKKLDILPRQVLIEVTVAEISLDTKTELGIEWSYVRGSGRRPDTSTLEAHIGVAGLNYVIGQTNRWFAALSALASDKKINILSSPSILASDNKEAKINISTEVPVASAIYNRDDDSNIVETSIQYRNTGVILSVTPHINEYGLVSMDISQEVSNQLEDSIQVGTGSQPAFFKRSVNTSLTVKDGQTIVIGGLIEQTENRGFSGVPCLGNIPLLQYVFGKKSRSIDKKELILLITPRVIASLEDVDAVTEEFKAKVGNVMMKGDL